MIRGERVGLRARLPEDVPVLQAELYDDVETHSRASGRPWVPLRSDSSRAPFRADDPQDDRVMFSVVELSTQELAGSCLLWGVDNHSRCAHLGLSMRPGCRGRGLGTDALRTLCHYGFAVRGLYRLQLETVAGNTAMVDAALRVGFRREGTLRSGAWVTGRFVDVEILGMLATEYPDSPPAAARAMSET